jgi:hypothetical protein
MKLHSLALPLCALVFTPYFLVPSAQTTFSVSLDIFYPSNLAVWDEK